MATAAKANPAESSKSLAANLGKHHFWILLVIVVAAVVSVWYLSTADLQAAFKSDSIRINAAFTGIDTMPTPLRNDEMTKSVAAEQLKIRDQAVAAWNVLYDRQRPLFQWPDDMKHPPKMAGQTENEQTQRKSYGDLPPQSPEAIALRDQFQQFVVKREWENLFWEAQPILDDGEAPPAGIQDYKQIVEWPRGVRGELLQRYLSSKPPSDVRVRTAMEDIWIYQNFVDIIRDMNLGAADRGQATIKRIRALEIAQWAIRNAHEYQGPDTPEVVGARTGGAGRPFVTPPRVGDSHPTDKALLNGRYVDADNNPIPDGAAPPFAEFRQMFVVMRFVMNQEAIPKLLARCANARFPIVARQVLMKFQDVDSEDQRGDAFDPAAFKYGSLGPTDAVVEIRGLIFLYETPDTPSTPAEKRKLGTGTAARPAHRKAGIPPLQERLE